MGKMKIVEYGSRLVEYELVRNSDDRCYIAFIVMGSILCISIKTEFDDVEEYLTMDQARHLQGWLDKSLNPGDGEAKP